MILQHTVGRQLYFRGAGRIQAVVHVKIRAVSIVA